VRRAFVGGACLSFLHATAPAVSAAERVPTRLVWDGSVCGSQQDFAARVVQRNRAIRFVSSGEEVAVRLSIQPGSNGLDARVRIEAKGRAPVTRRIQSPDCDDALDALALVVAIGVEGRPRSAGRRPRARVAAPRRIPARPAVAPAPPSAAPEPEPPAPAPPEPSAPATPPSEPTPPTGAASGAPSGSPDRAVEPPLAETAAPAAAANLPEPGSAAEAPPAVTDVGTTASASESATGGVLIGAGLAALSSVGIAPDPMLGGAVWVSAEWDRAGAWAPEMVLDAMHQERGDHDEARGEAGFSLNAVSLAVCPLRFGKSTLELRPCLSGALGQLESDGGQTYSPRDQTRPWSSIGASLSASVVFGIVELRASLGASTPLHRDSFRFGPECSGAACEADVFHRVAPLIWTGALGAGLTPR
jgi:hypothetical protein